MACDKLRKRTLFDDKLKHSNTPTYFVESFALLSPEVVRFLLQTSRGGLAEIFRAFRFALIIYEKAIREALISLFSLEPRASIMTMKWYEQTPLANAIYHSARLSLLLSHKPCGFHLNSQLNLSNASRLNDLVTSF